MVKWRSLILGGVISAACLALLLRQVDLGRTWESLTQADAGWLGLSLVTIVGALLLRFWRWQLLFLPQNRVSLRGSAVATLVGYMFNTVLPGRVGELARASLIGHTDRVGTPRALGTIVVEKILDVLVLLVFLGILVSMLPLPEAITGAGVKASIAFGALAVAFFAAAVFRGTVVGWAARYLDPLPLLGRLHPSRTIHLVLDGADGLRRPHLLLGQLVLSTALWGVAMLTIVLTFRAFNLDVPWTAAALVLVTTNLGMTVPSAPGYLGVYHYIAVETLRLFDVEPATALACAFVLHTVGFGSFTLAGAILLLAGLARQEYALGDLWRWQARPAAGDPGAGAERPRVTQAA